MRTLSKRESRIFVICVAVIAVYVGYQVIYKSLRKKSGSLEDTIESYKMRLEKSQKILQKENAIDAEYRQWSNRLQQNRSDEQEMTLILSEIESVANQIGMRVSDMKPQKVRRVDFYNQFNINLTIDGELVAILNFLYLLENQPHGFDIVDMRLERSSAAGNQLRCFLTLSRILVPPFNS